MGGWGRGGDSHQEGGEREKGRGCTTPCRPPNTQRLPRAGSSAGRAPSAQARALRLASHVHRHGDGLVPDSVQKRGLIVGWYVREARERDGCGRRIKAACAVQRLVGVGRGRRHPTDGDGGLEGGAGPATPAAKASGVAVDQVALREIGQRAGGDEVCGLDGSSGGKGPAAAAVALFLDGYDVRWGGGVRHDAGHAGHAGGLPRPNPSSSLPGT